MLNPVVQDKMKAVFQIVEELNRMVAGPYLTMKGMLWNDSYCKLTLL